MATAHRHTKSNLLLDAWSALVVAVAEAGHAASTDLLEGTETDDPLKCRVGADGPNTHAVWQAFRLSRSLDAVCHELKINPDQALQALVFYARHPLRRDAERLEWEQLGLAELFKHDDEIRAE